MRNDWSLCIFTASKKANLYPVFHSVLVEDICDVFPVFPDGQQTLLHVEGAAGDQEEVEAGLGHLELAGLGVHRIPDVDRAALIGRNFIQTFNFTSCEHLNYQAESFC